MYSSPAVVDGVLYMGSMDRTVYAFGSEAQSDLGSLLIYVIAGVAAAIIVVLVIALMLKKQRKTKPAD
jgi:uncharacterized membrane protein YuzA (DUF378 family)